MRQRNRKTDITNVVIVIIAIISIALVLINSFAKYQENKNENSNAYIATFIVKDTMSKSLGLQLSDIGPGDKQIHNFSVMNYDNNGEAADVAINYNITVKTSKNLPLTIKLYSNEYTKENLLTKKEDVTNENVYTTTSDLTFDAGIKKEQVYDIEIEWTGASDEKYVDELDYIDLYIDAVQAVPDN